jgi:hypothetical protein
LAHALALIDHESHIPVLISLEMPGLTQAIILKKNLRIGEVVSKYDKNNDGELSREEFTAQSFEMGLEASVPDVYLFFDTLDADGDGTLDIEELKKAFTRMLAMAEAARRETLAAEKAFEKVRRAAVKQQSILMAALARDEQQKRDHAE